MPLAVPHGTLILGMNAGRALVNRQFTMLGGSRVRLEHGWARRLPGGRASTWLAARPPISGNSGRRRRVCRVECGALEARGFSLDALFTVIAGVVSRSEPWDDSGTN